MFAKNESAHDIILELDFNITLKSYVEPSVTKVSIFIVLGWNRSAPDFEIVQVLF